MKEMNNDREEKNLLKNIKNIQDNNKEFINEISKEEIEEKILNLFNDHVNKIYKNEYDKYDLLENWCYSKDEEFSCEYEDIINKLLDDYQDHSSIFDNYQHI